MRRGIFLSIIAAVILAAVAWLLICAPDPGADGQGTAFRTQGNRIQIHRGDQWEDFEIRGVNIGTGYPGVFPNEYGIPEDTYYRWFELISQMNANTVRVYKIQSPAFYKAFARYNRENEEKLYLLQGIDFTDHLMYSSDNVLDADLVEEILRETRVQADALHGNAVVMDWEKAELYIYNHDVSQYTLGYVMGVEWDEIYVEYICQRNPSFRLYEGQFLTCREDANAFESFLASWADGLLAYEHKTYGTQKLMSFCNWALTDPLINQYPVQTEVDHGYVERTESLLDMEHILGTGKLESGLFAAYNVYPYFPEFLQAGPYTEQPEADGEVNPYRTYLSELERHHSYPMVITEFGLPASRSAAYDDKWRKMDHGGLTEAEQGRYLQQMYEDIRAVGCAGAIVFSWQDEWYKTIWNDRLLSNPDGRADWCNVQSAESFFGILGFEPGEAGETPYPDGSLEEWRDKDRISETGDVTLSLKADEKYLYLLVQCSGDIRDQDLRVALDITPRSGASVVEGTALSREADFLVKLEPGGKATLLVQRYYDSSLYSVIGGYPFRSLEMFYHSSYNQMAEDLSPDMPVFDPVTRALNNVEITMNQQEGHVGSIHLDVGTLKEGNGNPDGDNYDSNADFCYASGAVEIRLPWQLLNFSDPARRRILDDFRINNYQRLELEIKGIYAAAYRAGEPKVKKFGFFDLDSWENPSFHERLKESYYIVQDMFGKAGAQ